MRPTSPLARAVAACSLAGCAFAAAAQLDDGAMEVTQSLAPASTTHGVAEQAQPAMQTMLWRSRGAFGVGVGIEQPLPHLPDPRPRRTDALLLGLSMATGPRTRLSWQTAVAGLPPHERPMQISLTFTRRSALREIRRGSLLRMQIGGQTSVALKLRRGRLGLALTSRW